MSPTKSYQCKGQLTLAELFPDSWSGKMCREHSVPTKEKISDASSKKQRESQTKMPLFLDLRQEKTENKSGVSQDASWQTDGQSLGAYMIANGSVCLKDANEYVCVLTSEDNPHQEFYLNCGEKPLTPNPTKLSQILEINPDSKYNLSAKACQGILNRAERRGKELPPILKEALIRQASPLRSGGGREVDSNGRKAGKGALVQTELSGTLGVSQDQTLITTINQVNILNPSDSQGNQVADSNGVYPTLRGSGGAGYQQGYLLDESKVYGISSYDSNAMKSDNPHSGVYEADTSRTLDLNGGNPACNQGGMAIVQGADMYNGAITGDIAATLNATSCVSGGQSGPSVVCIEGNGQRESHKGDGYKESDTMYTLNMVEQHAVAYRKTSHAKSAEDGQGLAETEVNDTLNAFDSGETRTPTVVLENHPQDSRVKISEDGVVQTLSKQSGNVPMVIEQPYNATTGSFMRAGNSGIAETLAARDYKDPQIVCNSVVRRLTPLECERLQGFPVVRKVRFTEMTKDEYIAWNINEGHIVVDTEYGKVFATRGPGGAKLDEPKELTGSVVNGYKVVSIRNGETKMQCRVHRIVWIAEHGIIPDGYVIDHINNDKADNRIANLQLLTATENSTKARQDGLYKVHEDAGQAKISDEVHDLIQYVYGNTDLTCRQMAEIFGISKSRVHQIIHDEPWTDIGEWVDSKGKTHKGDSDSPRYKALGNSIALPYWSWMAGRMVAVLKADGVEQPTMSSLFDGIGGFPLVFSRAGAKPIWASEIEEFPIAVTKIRFPEEEENK